MRHTLDGKQLLSINRAALKILGFESPEELMAEGFNLVAASVLEEDREMLQEKIKSLQKEGDNVSVEYRVRRKDGDIRHVMGNVKLLRENGRLIYQRFLLDCTAQKLQEKEKERRQKELIQALSIDYNVVCHFDLDTGAGDLLRIADTDKCLFGAIFNQRLSLEDNMKLYIEQFVYEEDKEMLRQAVCRQQPGRFFGGKVFVKFRRFFLFFRIYGILKKPSCYAFQGVVIQFHGHQGVRGTPVG